MKTPPMIIPIANPGCPPQSRIGYMKVSHFQFSNNVAVVELTIEVVEMVDSVALAIAEDTVDDVTAAVVEFDTGSQ